jgi:hypothetical protein
MILNKQEAENLLIMLTSDDKDNAYIAFQAINAYKFKKDEIGYLAYLYKFGKPDKDQWEEHSPTAYKQLKKYFNMDQPLTYARALATMIENKNKNEIVSMFLERHVKQLAAMLDTMGYPVDKLDIKIQLKDE